MSSAGKRSPYFNGLGELFFIWVDTCIQPIKIWVNYGLAKLVKLRTFIYSKFVISLKIVSIGAKFKGFFYYVFSLFNILLFSCFTCIIGTT